MLRRIFPPILATLLLLIPATATAVPTVDGLFYALGDDSEYVLWNTSLYGSGLYIYYDAANTTLYVALVVTRAVNDNVGGTPIVVLWGGDTADALDTSTVADGAAIGSGIAFHRQVGDDVLTFSSVGDDLFTDVETGTETFRTAGAGSNE